MDNRLIITIFIVILPSAFIGANELGLPPSGFDEMGMLPMMMMMPMIEPRGKLMTLVDRTGCKTERFCLSEPSNCNPNGLLPCIFASARRIEGQDFEIVLAGDTLGFIGLTLQSNIVRGGNDITCVCARGKGNRIRFFRYSDNLTKTMLSASAVRGHLNGNKVECVFNVTIPDSSSEKQSRRRSVVPTIITGFFDPDSGALGTPTARIMSNAVDLRDPTSDTTNLISNSSTVLHHSLVLALLMTLAAISLALA